MEVSLTRESEKNFLQRQEIETLKKQLEEIRYVFYNALPYR